MDVAQVLTRDVDRHRVRHLAAEFEAVVVDVGDDDVTRAHMAADGRVSVDMGAPDFELSALPFDASGLQARHTLGWSTWPLEVTAHGQQTVLHTAVLSMGNPHAVQLVDNVDSAPVAEWGPQIESHTRFARHVNAGFMQIVEIAKALSKRARILVMDEPTSSLSEAETEALFDLVVIVSVVSAYMENHNCCEPVAC